MLACLTVAVLLLQAGPPCLQCIAATRTYQRAGRGTRTTRMSRLWGFFSISTQHTPARSRYTASAKGERRHCTAHSCLTHASVSSPLPLLSYMCSVEGRELLAVRLTGGRHRDKVKVKVRCGLLGLWVCLDSGSCCRFAAVLCVSATAPPLLLALT